MHLLSYIFYFITKSTIQFVRSNYRLAASGLLINTCVMFDLTHLQVTGLRREYFYSATILGAVKSIIYSEGPTLTEIHSIYSKILSS